MWAQCIWQAVRLIKTISLRLSKRYTILHSFHFLNLKGHGHSPPGLVFQAEEPNTLSLSCSLLFISIPISPLPACHLSPWHRTARTQYSAVHPLSSSTSKQQHYAIGRLYIRRLSLVLNHQHPHALWPLRQSCLLTSTLSPYHGWNKLSKPVQQDL